MTDHDRSGPRSLYRPKERPTSIALTAFGRRLLKAKSKRDKISQSDVVERLLRLDALVPFESKERP